MQEGIVPYSTVHVVLCAGGFPNKQRLVLNVLIRYRYGTNDTAVPVWYRHRYGKVPVPWNSWKLRFEMENNAYEYGTVRYGIFVFVQQLRFANVSQA